jgi:DNA-binding IscR family transcriptional regulator
MPIDDPLSERAQAMLVAMIEMNAVDSDRRETTEDIVARALGATASPNAVKEVMAELNARQFVNSKQGRGGGIWLTEKGRDRANKLRDR